MDWRYLVFIIWPLIPIVLFTENPILDKIDKWATKDAKIDKCFRK